MTEKTEWEIVDEPGQQAHRSADPESMAKGLLGPWWRWKVAGVATVAALVIALFLAFAGVVVVFMVAAALLSIFIGKFTRWLRGSHAATGVQHRHDR